MAAQTTTTDAKSLFCPIAPRHLTGEDALKEISTTSATIPVQISAIAQIGTKMTMPKLIASISLIMILTTSCSYIDEHVFTLYKNEYDSPMSRERWATFDNMSDTVSNEHMCNSTAHALNATLVSLDTPHVSISGKEIGFWCERGRFNMNGRIPTSFRRSAPDNLNTGQS